MDLVVPYKITPLTRPQINPIFGSLNLYCRHNEGFASLMYYSVLLEGDPSLVLRTCMLRPLFKKQGVILSGSVVDWRNAYNTCEDQQFLNLCYEFISKEMEIFQIKRENHKWKVLKSG